MAASVGESVHGQACRTTATTFLILFTAHIHALMMTLNSLPPLACRASPLVTHTHTHTPQLFCAIVFKCPTKTLRCGGAIASCDTPATDQTHNLRVQELVNGCLQGLAWSLCPPVQPSPLQPLNKLLHFCPRRNPSTLQLARSINRQTATQT